MEGSDKESVQLVVSRIEQYFKDEADRSHELVMLIPRMAFPVIIGRQGSVIRELQSQSGCRIDLDNSKGIATLRGR